MRSTGLFLLMLTVPLAAAQKLPPNVQKTAKAAKAAVATKKKAAAVAQPQPQPTPAQPVVPLRPSQMPSVLPRVSYQQGLLTVVAENSTIADILGAIRQATGIRIESTAGPSGDRVAAKIGPARPREVLLSLLQGSRFDYVMLGSANDPEQIERVILSPKLPAGAASTPGTQVAQQQQPQPPAQPYKDPQDTIDPNEPDSEEPGEPPLRGGEDNPSDQSQQPQPEQQPPVQNSTNPNGPLNQQAQPPDQQQQQQQQQQPNGVKTPEQILQELRDQQRRNTEQQNQNPR